MKNKDIDIEMGSDISNNETKRPADSEKMNPKKKKRLENFMKKKLAKDEKADLLAKLAVSSFSSQLMQSSRSLGQGKMTSREKVRLAFNQQKAGIPVSDPSVRLLVEKTMTEAPSQQKTVSLSPGTSLKNASSLSAIPLKVKKKSKTMVSVKELLRKVRPEEENGFDSSSSFDSSASDTEDENEELASAKPKDLEQAPTTSLEYLQAPSLPEVEIKASKTHIEKKNPTVSNGPKAFYIPINRPLDIQAARMQLPVCAEEQRIMETINDNDVVIICGETGSGKTTQIPQFLYEAGYGDPKSPNPGMVGITQPRRVAAVSMANRVAKELITTSDQVSYQIRYDATTSANTRVKFMTDGVLLREVSQDFLLSKYSALLLDEAHERTLNTDILIGVLSRAIRLRNKFFKEGKPDIKPLKLIIMSATLRVEDFVNNIALFPSGPPPPVLRVEARQHPVTMHFNKRTIEHDIIGEAFKKIVKIHTRLPGGGILVFLTGQNEISDLCRRLRRRFPSTQNDSTVISSKSKATMEIEAEDMVDDVSDFEDTSLGFDEEFGNSEEELDSDAEKLELSEEVSDAPLHVLPLYALLPTSHQLRVFEAVPPGHRLCVVATNVAETSLTIPNITYVVDSGKAKEKHFDTRSSATSFNIDWVSKASADQRAGRAGRTGPGHCYRLYSSAVFNDQFEQFATPEIHRTPIEGVVLQMKSMNLDNVANFPFPTPPSKQSILKAERHLKFLGALNDESHITPLGKLMASFPVAPRYSKMLAIGQQHNCMPYSIALVASLSVGDPFLKEHQACENDEEEDFDEMAALAKSTKRKFYEALATFTSRDHQSDLLRVLMAVGAFEYSGGKDEFCSNNFLRPKAMDEIRKLRRQLTNLVQTYCPSVDVSLDPKLLPPSKIQAQALKQIILAGFVDQVAILKKLVDKNSPHPKGYRPKGITGTAAYRTMWGDEDVFIHPTSALYLQDPSPPYVIYSQLSVTSSGTTLMQGVTAIDARWLITIAKPLVSFSKPLDETKLSTRPKDKKEQSVMVSASFGPKSWPLPNQQIFLSQSK